VSAAAPRAIRLLRSGEPHSKISDTLILASDERRVQRARVVSARGIAIEFDLPEPVALRTDDVLVLDTGELVDVVAAPEPLIEVRGEHFNLARIAWALGDRHVPAQFLPNRIRLRTDPALVTLIAAIGGKVTAIEAPFEPEGGAYAGHAHDLHDHAGHTHDHDHREHDHHHGHAHKHGEHS
jgi:urease accessory protein